MVEDGSYRKRKGETVWFCSQSMWPRGHLGVGDKADERQPWAYDIRQPWAYDIRVILLVPAMFPISGSSSEIS